MSKPGKICQNVDTVKQTTQSQSDESDEEINGNNQQRKKDTRVGNGFLKSVYSYLFLEQPNLEDKISLRGEGLS